MNGYAYFSGCSINLGSASAYTLSATSSAGYTAATSSAFYIGGTSEQLVFVTQPGGGPAGSMWSQQPVVAVENTANQVMTTDNSTIVYLSIGTNPAGGTLSCTGGTSEQVVNGYAYFSGCSINAASTSQYTLSATSNPTWTSATSAGFYVGGAQSTVALSRASAIGVTTSGPYSLSTKVVRKGAYITIKITTSPAMAGADIGIWVAKKVERRLDQLLAPHGPDRGLPGRRVLLLQGRLSRLAVLQGAVLRRCDARAGLVRLGPGALDLLNPRGAAGAWTSATGEGRDGNVPALVPASPMPTGRFRVEASGGTPSPCAKRLSPLVKPWPYREWSSACDDAGAQWRVEMSGPISGIPRPSRLLGLALGAAFLGSLIPFAGVAAAANHLVVSASVAGSYLSGAPLTITVTAANPDGTTATGYTGTVHFTSSDGTATLPSNYTFVVGDDGSHQFTSGAVLNTAGSQTITATDTVTSSITGVTSSVAVKLQLAFTQQPGGGSGGIPLAPQPVVQLRTYAGVAAGDAIGGTATVTLATSLNTVGGTLSGCTGGTASAGTATFAGCEIDKVGTYTLAASSANALSATSNSFAVSPGSAVGLQYVGYPTNPSTTSLAMISVRIVDAGGNAASGNPTATIVLSLSTNPGGTTLSCSSGVATTNGTATFSGCTLTGGAPVANGYKLTATATSSSPALVQTSVAGTAFNVTSGPPTKLAFYWNTVGTTTVPTGSTGGSRLPDAARDRPAGRERQHGDLQSAGDRHAGDHEQRHWRDAHLHEWSVARARLRASRRSAGARSTRSGRTS